MWLIDTKKHKAAKRSKKKQKEAKRSKKKQKEAQRSTKKHKATQSLATTIIHPPHKSATIQFYEVNPSKSAFHEVIRKIRVPFNKHE